MKSWQMKWHNWQDRMKRVLRNSHAHRMFGAQVFHSRIWAVNVNALAGGLSLGLFVAFTPTIPFQMLLCVMGALVLHVNLPIAVAACWITNPITALPIYMYAYRLGRVLLVGTRLAEFTFDLFEFESRTGRFVEQSLYLWAGCIVLAATFALVGNLAVRCAAIALRMLKKHFPHVS